MTRGKQDPDQQRSKWPKRRHRAFAHFGSLGGSGERQQAADGSTVRRGLAGIDDAHNCPLTKAVFMVEWRKWKYVCVRRPYRTVVPTKYAVAYGKHRDRRQQRFLTAVRCDPRYERRTGHLRQQTVSNGKPHRGRNRRPFPFLLPSIPRQSNGRRFLLRQPVGRQRQAFRIRGRVLHYGQSCLIHRC